MHCYIDCDICFTFYHSCRWLWCNKSHKTAAHPMSYHMLTHTEVGMHVVYIHKVYELGDEDTANNIFVLKETYPTLAREFQGFRMCGKFVFRTLGPTDTPNNLANQVKLGRTLDNLDKSRSLQWRGPERTHQSNSVRRGQIAFFWVIFRRLSGYNWFLSVG